ncbi:hypothetical protein [Kitasatospora mediocidica]|uniref:hypothetical protein n=1 Tax=Kitasatospora mediocidica TaxID=58352 RepID=UPI0012FBF4E9|nr:hypothetical protein [Kitasatospora mediocidica]
MITGNSINPVSGLSILAGRRFPAILKLLHGKCPVQCSNEWRPAMSRVTEDPNVNVVEDFVAEESKFVAERD